MTILKQLIEKSRKTPVLAHIYAMELDRQLRNMAKPTITFSAISMSDGAADMVKALGLDKVFNAQPTPHAGDTIYRAEMLAKNNNRIEAIAHAFANAQGAEINALNLFYANHSTKNPELRLYFLNKYLAAYGLQIEQEEGGGQSFFHRIRSPQTTPKVGGPLVTIIMPAHNAESTIELAVGSLLNQTWQNLQIIVVDDASTDATLQKAKEIAKTDSRVQVLKNLKNAGPYVSRNHGLMHACGQWITVHDADDWAFPDRIEQQVNWLKGSHACTGGMLRIDATGQITRPYITKEINKDGYQRMCMASLMVTNETFYKELGAWDSVKVGGDVELITRLKVLGIKTTHQNRPLMLCLDHEKGLTNHAELGLVAENGKPSLVRKDYRQSYEKWHRTEATKKLLTHPMLRPFEVSKANQIPKDVIGDFEKII
jgi:hypothetical protein